MTSLKDEILTIAQHYRDRADIENVFVMPRLLPLVHSYSTLLGDRHGTQAQKRVVITSSHAKHASVRKVLSAASGFLSKIKQSAEQLTDFQRWRLILSKIFIRFLRGKVLGGVPPQIGRLALA